MTSSSSSSSSSPSLSSTSSSSATPATTGTAKATTPAVLSRDDFPHLRYGDVLPFNSYVTEPIVTKAGITLTYHHATRRLDLFVDDKDCVAVIKCTGGDTVLNAPGDMSLNMPAKEIHIVGYRLDKSSFFELQNGNLYTRGKSYQAL